MFLIWSLSLCVDFRLIMMIFVLATLNIVQEESQEESYVVKDKMATVMMSTIWQRLYNWKV